MSLAGRYRGFFLDEAFDSRQALLNSPGMFHCWMQIDGSLRVKAADPVVWCSGQLLAMLHAGDHHPQVSFECVLDGRHGHVEPLDTGGAYIGDIIRVTTPERRYVYVITRRVSAEHQVWEAQWLD